MKKLISKNGVYGGKVGNKFVFTADGAIEIYKLFVEICYSPLTIGSAADLFSVEEDMIALGFTWEQLEEIEQSVIEALPV